MEFYKIKGVRYWVSESDLSSEIAKRITKRRQGRLADEKIVIHRYFKDQLDIKLVLRPILGHKVNYVLTHKTLVKEGQRNKTSVRGSFGCTRFTASLLKELSLDNAQKIVSSLTQCVTDYDWINVIKELN